MITLVTIVDYGVGNLYSLYSSFKYIGADVNITGCPDEIKNAKHLLLPGGGAFGSGAEKLRETGLDKLVIAHGKQGKPLLGICLGMQLLFEKGYEYGEHEGLGLIPGEVKMLDSSGVKIPHMGWNKLEIKKESPLLKGIPDKSYFYYIHSYGVEGNTGFTTATTTYGNNTICGLANKDNIFGIQFHPEKSGALGLKILENFIKNTK